MSFERYHRTIESVQEFTAEFDSRYQKLLKHGIILPQTILAFKLLNQANITEEEQMLVKSGIDYEQKETMYDQCIMSIKKFKGNTSRDSVNRQNTAIKIEPAFATSSSNYYPSQRGLRYYRGRYNQYRGNQRGTSFKRNENFGTF